MANAYQTILKGISRTKTAQAIERVASAGIPGAAEQLTSYTETLKSQVKPKTLENYTNQLSTIIRSIKKAPDDLDNKDLRAYFSSIEDKSAGTKYSMWQSLRSYCCDYRKYDRIMNKDLTSKWETIMANIKRPEQSKRNLSDKDLITMIDLQKLLQAAKNDRDKAFFSCLFETGSRISELASMEIKDVRLDSAPLEMQIKHSKTGEKGKRTVYLIKSAPYLRRWLESHPHNKDATFYRSDAPLWVSQDKHAKPVTPSAWFATLKRATKNAGIEKNIFHHLFRHSRAFDLYQNYGMDIKQIKTLLGHKKLETTDGYIVVDRSTIIERLQGGVEASEEAERKRQAVRAGQPVVCACGTENEPTKAFCSSCGAVVNEDVAREIYAKKDDEKQALEKRLKLMEETMMLILETKADVNTIERIKNKQSINKNV